eukprot:gene6910-14028_t
MGLLINNINILMNYISVRRLMLSVIYFWFFTSFPALCKSYTTKALLDKVDNLPGTESFKIPFRQFSGYLDVSPTKKMHYWFVESIRSPTDDPIVFWTNGGPGCSGLIGLLWELGPFKPNADQTLSFNKNTWNQVANIIFIEAPCGVGFSYSTAPDNVDYITNDDKTAHDNYKLIQEFFIRFPQYFKNKLYLASESYGGHYIPTLAKLIVNNNKLEINPKLNFKGFAIGNPYTTSYSGEGAMYETYWGHQLISKPLWDQYKTACLPNYYNEHCYNLQSLMDDQIGNQNVYALDFPICEQDNPSTHGREQRLWLQHHIKMNKLNRLKTDIGTNVNDNTNSNGNNNNDNKNIQYQNTGDLSVSFTSPSVRMDYKPCIDDYTRSYLNRLDVKRALHVNENIAWGKCADIQYDYSNMDISMVSHYNDLIDGNYDLDILIYSGDDDGVCATLGTQNWIWDLGYEAQEPSWQHYFVNGQPAGYLSRWKNTKLAFLTVHGAGHEVPLFKPEIAFQMWKDFLYGNLTSTGVAGGKPINRVVKPHGFTVIDHLSTVKSAIYHNPLIITSSDRSSKASVQRYPPHQIQSQVRLIFHPSPRQTPPPLTISPTTDEHGTTQATTQQ